MKNTKLDSNKIIPNNLPINSNQILTPKKVFMKNLSLDEFLPESILIIKELICGLCKGVYKNPVYEECGHTFCKECIETSIKIIDFCPSCNKQYTSKSFKEATYFQNLIVKQKVFCKNKYLGCNWEGTLIERENHLIKACHKRIIFCKECEVQNKKFEGFPEEVEFHFENFCDFKIIECKNKCGISFQRFLETSHLQDCPKGIALCPLECKAHVIREKINEHIINECPLQKINCEFSIIGCETTFTRQNEKLHIQNYKFSHNNNMISYLKQFEENLNKILFNNLFDFKNKLEYKEKYIDEKFEIILKKINDNYNFKEEQIRKKKDKEKFQARELGLEDQDIKIEEIQEENKTYRDINQGIFNNNQNKLNEKQTSKSQINPLYDSIIHNDFKIINKDIETKCNEIVSKYFDNKNYKNSNLKYIKNNSNIIENQDIYENQKHENISKNKIADKNQNSINNNLYDIELNNDEDIKKLINSTITKEDKKNCPSNLENLIIKETSIDPPQNNNNHQRLLIEENHSEKSLINKKRKRISMNSISDVDETHKIVFNEFNTESISNPLNSQALNIINYSIINKSNEISNNTDLEINSEIDNYAHINSSYKSKINKENENSVIEDSKSNMNSSEFTFNPAKNKLNEDSSDSRNINENLNLSISSDKFYKGIMNNNMNKNLKNTNNKIDLKREILERKINELQKKELNNKINAGDLFTKNIKINNKSNLNTNTNKKFPNLIKDITNKHKNRNLNVNLNSPISINQNNIKNFNSKNLEIVLSDDDNDKQIRETKNYINITAYNLEDVFPNEKETTIEYTSKNESLQKSKNQSIEKIKNFLKKRENEKKIYEDFLQNYISNISNKETHEDSENSNSSSSHQKDCLNAVNMSQNLNNSNNENTLLNENKKVGENEEKNTKINYNLEESYYQIASPNTKKFNDYQNNINIDNIKRKDHEELQFLNLKEKTSEYYDQDLNSKNSKENNVENHLSKNEAKLLNESKIEIKKEGIELSETFICFKREGEENLLNNNLFNKDELLNDIEKSKKIINIEGSLLIENISNLNKCEEILNQNRYDDGKDYENEKENQLNINIVKPEKISDENNMEIEIYSNLHLNSNNIIKENLESIDNLTLNKNFKKNISLLEEIKPINDLEIQITEIHLNFKSNSSKSNSASKESIQKFSEKNNNFSSKENSAQKSERKIKKKIETSKGFPIIDLSDTIPHLIQRETNIESHSNYYQNNEDNTNSIIISDKQNIPKIFSEKITDIYNNSNLYNLNTIDKEDKIEKNVYKINMLDTEIFQINSKEKIIEDTKYNENIFYNENENLYLKNNIIIDKGDEVKIMSNDNIPRIETIFFQKENNEYQNISCENQSAITISEREKEHKTIIIGSDDKLNTCLNDFLQNERKLETKIKIFDSSYKNDIITENQTICGEYKNQLDYPVELYNKNINILNINSLSPNTRPLYFSDIDDKNSNQSGKSEISSDMRNLSINKNLFFQNSDYLEEEAKMKNESQLVFDQKNISNKINIISENRISVCKCNNLENIISMIDYPLNNPKRIYRWKIRLIKVTGWIAIGICYKETVISNNYKFVFGKNIINSHGVFVFSLNGYKWNTSVKNEDNQKTCNFPKINLEENNEVQLEYNPTNKLLLFNYGNYQAKLKYINADGTKTILPCVIMAGDESELEVLKI